MGPVGTQVHDDLAQLGRVGQDNIIGIFNKGAKLLLAAFRYTLNVNSRIVPETTQVGEGRAGKGGPKLAFAHAPGFGLIQDSSDLLSHFSHDNGFHNKGLDAHCFGLGLVYLFTEAGA